MKYIEAVEPFEFAPQPILFTAGGITDCPNWQADLVDLLRDQPITILNPRRACFDVRDPNASREQIEWEYFALQKADLISFWFPKETLCPITLFELGAWSSSSKPILVATDPEYKRRVDVVTQMSLKRPNLQVGDSIEQLADQIKDANSWASA